MTAAGATAAGWYVYGVVAADSDVEHVVRDAHAIDPEHGVVVIGERGVAALVSRVALEEFEALQSPEATVDVSWLIDKTSRHEDVLDRALAATAVVPFRFGTIYRDEPAVRTFLADNGDAFQRVLARLDGRVEVGVKAFVDRTRLEDALLEQDPAAASGSGGSTSVSAGRAYLLRRQHERAVAEQVAEFEALCSAESHELLTEHAEDARLNPPQRRELSGRAEPMIVNGAYLVTAPADVEPAVSELRRRYESFGVEYEVTGPWPAYNFVGEEWE